MSGEFVAPTYLAAMQTISRELLEAEENVFDEFLKGQAEWWRISRLPEGDPERVAAERVWAQQRAKRDAEERALLKKNQAKASRWAELAGPVGAAVLEIHSPNSYGDCDGCNDEMGRKWPCPTARTVRRASR